MLIVFGVGIAHSQEAFYVKFSFYNQSQPFSLNEVMPSYNGVDYSVQELAFFMSRVQLIHDGGQVTTIDSNTVFYINFNTPEVLLGYLPVTTIEGIRFDVGVPEYLNHLDISQYPVGAPLSYHTPSMHWGWSSGYMHMTMNGKGDTDNDGIPTQNYELSCLGDHNVHTVELPTPATVYPDNFQQIVVICNLDQWLRGSDPATTGAAHSDTGVNETVMSNIINYPVFTTAATAAVTEQEQLPVHVAQTERAACISWGTERPVAAYRMIDAEGRILAHGNCTQQQLQFSELTSGLHIVQLLTENDALIGTAKWIVP